ncbi:hypothetical protein CEP53_009821 [Fusarium sp. AF-6]|nr:hypothetical protein CEP53_009821 [Fusarium sp. AF-6]
MYKMKQRTSTRHEIYPVSLLGMGRLFNLTSPSGLPRSLPTLNTVQLVTYEALSVTADNPPLSYLDIGA